MIAAATRLTAEQLAKLRAQAGRVSDSFIDPRAFRAVRDAGFHAEWATAVLGRPYPGWNRVAPWEISLLALALKAEPDRPEPPAVQARREAQQRASDDYSRRQAEQEAAARATWHALRDRLPVPVTVGHNWTMVHLGHYQVGRDHIVVQADLHQGRLHRQAEQVLCEIPSHKKRYASYNGTSRNPLRGVDRGDDGQDRVPTCKACLRIAGQVADRADAARQSWPELYGEENA